MVKQADYTHKLLIVGDRGVGKTTFVDRHVTGKSEKKYIDALKTHVSPMQFNTNYGSFLLNVWDPAEVERADMRDEHYIDTSAAIIMFDLTSRITYANVSQWYKDLVRVVENVPTVLVGNKADVKERKVKAKEVTFHRKYNLQYYEVSAKSNYNFEKPFLWLMRKLANEATLELTEDVPLADPEEEVDDALLAQLTDELKIVAATTLPSAEDDL